MKIRHCFHCSAVPRLLVLGCHTGLTNLSCLAVRIPKRTNLRKARSIGHVRCELYIQHVSFAKVWNRNLLSQGYLQAFRPTEHIRH